MLCLEYSMDLIKIRNLSFKELFEHMLEAGHPKFRAKQIFTWQNQKLVQSFNDMTNLPKALIEYLNKNFILQTLTVQKKLTSKDGNTTKLLYKLSDNNLIESVVMKYNYGCSVCVSTQVGCKMGCEFCCSGADGFVRNLEPAEILEQVIVAQRLIKQRIGHVVLMGIGEPLDNFDNVVKFISLVTNKDGLNISGRNISISTSGLVDKIYKLAELNLSCTLSISLHAPNNELRSKLMPVNNKWNLEELMQACRFYFKKTGRRISFEYIMINNLNDTIKQSHELAKLIKGYPTHVNLIPINSGKQTDFKPSTARNIKVFKHNLEQLGVNVTVRRTLGADINAACGQLKKKEIRR